jgi:DNA-binding LytR/AlgR family response regulator
MTCITIDDEPLALDVLQNYISKIPDLELVGRFTSALDALDIIAENKVDLLFLDIQMSDLTGIQFLKSLKNPPMVIFTTAYEDYALEGYELDIIDYLLKPIPFDRFLKGVNKAKDYLKVMKGKIGEEDGLKDFIFVRSEYQQVKVNLNEINYIEGLKDYVKIFTGPKPILSHQNLKSIEGKLPPNLFIRVHKSYIINIDKINSVQKHAIIVSGTEIPVGDSYRENLFKILKMDQS